MNTLRTPIILLAVVVVALIAWFLWVHEQAVTPSQTQTAAVVASTTSAAQTTSAASSTIQYPDEDAVASNIPGVWQSTDDPNYSIDVTSNGKWTDSYQGADASSTTSETGTYIFFASQNPDKDFTGTIVPGVTYLKVTEGSSVLYYSVLEVSGSNLQISYLDRGNTLSFVREQ